MSIDGIARNYLRRFQQAVIDAGGTSAGALEMATRTVVTSHFLEKAINEIKPGSVVHHDQAVGPENRPDWRIEDPLTFGVYAYGDHKGLNLRRPLQLSARDSDQIARYRDLGRPVFVFDGVEFLFFVNDNEPPERIELVPKPLDLTTDWSKLSINPSVEIHLRALLESPGFRKWTENELMEQLASRARLLSTSIATLLEAPVGSGESAAEEELLRALHQLYDLARENHDPGLTDSESCADFIAQVLVFGLFFAHASAPQYGESPEERRKHISEFWQGTAFTTLAEKLRPFHTIVQALGHTLSADNDLGVWYREAASVLAHAEYMGTEIGPTDFHTLFERFYEAFDKQTKFDRGVFYTPAVVTEWMTRITQLLLVERLGGGMQEIVEKLIDPCCGTGGFLESAIKFVGDVPAGPHFIGFEILPAPYALAHYRLSQVGQDWQHPPAVSIALTDTLSDRLVDPPPRGKDGFSDELAAAADWANPPVRVVIGNPPSTIHNFSEAPRTIIESLIDDFRPTLSERSGRQNIQQALRNEAYRFLRWSAKEIIDSGTGILSLVLPGAFAYAVSFKHARKWLLDSFDEIYVLILDQDLRTGQAVGQSMFEVQQGRLILFAVRAAAETAKTDGEPTIASLSVHNVAEWARSDKETFLEAAEPKIDDFVPVNACGPEWIFEAAATHASDPWEECWPLRASGSLTGIFISKCSAVKLAPTSLVFHTDPLILERRSRALALRSGGSWSKTPDQLREEWWRGQRKPPPANKFTDGVRAAVGAAAKIGTAIASYAFRPFMDGFILNDDLVFAELNATPGGGTRARPEIRAAFSQGAHGISVAPAPKDLGQSLTRFASFCWQLPDNDLVGRRNAMVFCDLFPEEKRGPNWDPAVHENITSEFRSLFTDPGDAIFYVYAVMSCQAYLDAFESRLFQLSDPENPARIPVASDPEIRNCIAKLGERAAKCETASGETNPIGLAISWPDGVDELAVQKCEVSSDAGSVKLVGSDGASVTIANVPTEVLALRISGHDVVDKWLRERTHAYLRRAFRKEDLKLLVTLLGRISQQLELLGEVSALLEGVLAGHHLVAPPPLPEPTS